jgi:hypothetical protein
VPRVDFKVRGCEESETAGVRTSLPDFAGARLTKKRNYRDGFLVELARATANQDGQGGKSAKQQRQPASTKPVVPVSQQKKNS